MPLYEYECKSCNKRLELRQKFSDEPATECPSCSGELTKLISNAAFSLKGGGWYTEGYNKGKSAETSSPCQSGGGCAGCPSATS